MSYNVISQSKDGFKSVDQEAVLEFMKSKLNYSLSKVRGSDNKFWINGKKVNDQYSMFIEGSKYYQLVINRFDFGVQASGDFNAWSVANIIKQEIREAL
jgi:hypothetical protein|tara:strand:+ start:278 stop:574 length:297 start_codon:yes stop_codon:yes gene_type:complete